MPISIEDRISPLTIETLMLLGNQVDVRGAHDLYFGGAQGILLKMVYCLVVVIRAVMESLSVIKYT